VRIALAEKKIPWEPIHVDLRKEEHKTPEFLALNPYGKVPVLIDNDGLIYESTIVNEYLEDRFPDPALIPRDPWGRAEVRLWEDYGDNMFLGPAEAIFIHNKGWRTFAPERLAQMRQQIQDSLSRVEKQLQGKQYLVRDTFTLADICFAPRIIMLDELGTPLNSAYKNVPAWIERIKERESLQGLET
jgi:glutathione S-transferase